MHSKDRFPPILFSTGTGTGKKSTNLSSQGKDPLSFFVHEKVETSSIFSCGLAGKFVSISIFLFYFFDNWRIF